MRRDEVKRGEARRGGAGRSEARRGEGRGGARRLTLKPSAGEAHEIREAARSEVRKDMGKLTPAKREHVQSTAEYARGVKKKRRDGG